MILKRFEISWHKCAAQIEGLVAEIFDVAERFLDFTSIGVRVHSSGGGGDVRDFVLRIIVCDMPATRIVCTFCGCGTIRRMNGIFDS